MHFFAEKLTAIITWWHNRFHEDPNGIDVLLLDAEEVNPITKWIVAGLVMAREPMLLSDLFKFFVKEDLDKIVQALDECIKDGLIISQDEKLHFGSIQE